MLRGCSPRGLRLLGTIRAAYALEVNSWSTPECNNESYLNKKGKMGDIDIERAIVSHYWKSARHSFSSSSSHNSDRHLKEFRLAQTGEGIKDCELVQWFVKEGDTVEEFGRICEVQSDKATIEITSPFSGTIHTLRHNPGDVILVGAVLADILTKGRANEGQDERSPNSSRETDSESKGMSSTRGDGKLTAQESTVSTSPAVRHIAKELHVDVNEIKGTGPKGRVTKHDVISHAEKSGKKTTAESGRLQAENTLSSLEIQSIVGEGTPSSAPVAQVVVVPLRGYRRSMMISMKKTTTIPHFHFCEEVDMGAIVQARKSMGESRTLAGARLTYLPFFIKAAALSLAEFPLLNSSLSPDGDSLLMHRNFNIGVAVATPLGLAVPNIKGVESKSIAEIAQELAKLQAAAASNQLRPEDVTGGTFTVSNIGSIGGTYATPLVNPPEVAIMALGRMQRVPRFVSDCDSSAVPAHIMNVSVGADHRVADGAAVAGFTQALKALVENPGLLLLALR